MNPVAAAAFAADLHIEPWHKWHLLADADSASQMAAVLHPVRPESRD
jgi:hypothetical protein